MIAPEVQSVHHIALLVRDLAASEYFYGQVLGLPVLRRWPNHDERTERSIWFDLGQGAFLAVEVNPLPHQETPEPSPPSGWHLLALSIARCEREAWRERLLRACYPCTEESPYTLYCRDPEGNRVGLSHWPEPATD